MKRLLHKNCLLCAVLLILGVFSTIAFDFWATETPNLNDAIVYIVYWTALVLRIFTYFILFLSCRVLADKLATHWTRTVILGSAWTVVGLLLAAITWWLLANGDAPYSSREVKRFTPVTLSDFAPGWTLAEVALGKDVAKLYTWYSAIQVEFIAIAIVSFWIALFLTIKARTQLTFHAYFAPIVAFALLLFYKLIVPWSFDWDFDIFIGDALIGPMIYNGVFSLLTLQYGGFAASAVWVGLIAFTNVLLIRIWSKAETAESPPLESRD